MSAKRTDAKMYPENMTPDLETFADRPVFIVGSPRSGTSMLLSLLDGHPNLVVFPGEMQFFRFLKNPTPENALTTGLKHTFSGDHALHGVSRERIRALLMQYWPRTQAPGQIMRAIAETYAAVAPHPEEEKVHWIEKTPSNYRLLPVLNAWFGPRAKYIWIVRDPRDTLASFRSKDPNYSLSAMAMAWGSQVRYLRIAQQRLGSRILLVRYEDIVGGLQRQISRIASFLGVSESHFDFVLSRNGFPLDDSNDPTGVNWFRPDVDQASVTRYKMHLSEQECAMLTDMVGWEMMHVDYLDAVPGGSGTPRSFALRKKLRELNYALEWYLPLLRQRAIANSGHNTWSRPGN